ncbi:FkbM family methyltransferase [Hoeflea sp.]|uniref:FkbM family methyltransferase n=1 Tax=Hoeflea sp. TaxID=1940281 RepID=UPI00374A5D4A
MLKKIRRHFAEKRNPHLKAQRLAYRRWRADKGETLRTRFPGLTPQSVVFDIGGFRGTWSDALFEYYGSQIQIFEPHPRFAAELESKYAAVPEISVNAFALGKQDGSMAISDAGDASSALKSEGAALAGRVVSTQDFMARFEPAVIDVAKINIEGGEYELLPALYEADQLGRFKLLQIQFHLFDTDHIAARDRIREQLSETHVCDWSYDFIWEQWSLKPQHG